jgi:kinesin family protein 5
MGDASVRVICRFRPTNAREQREEIDDDKSKAQIKFVGTDGIDIIQPGKEKLNFAFDRVFHSNALQEDIFKLSAKDTVDDVLQGYNGTIFAYGQTGAGKSFTMFGPDILEDSMKGIIPRACSHIFEHITNDTSGAEYTIKCSFLEIYKEVIRDLLNPKGNNLKVRETPSRGVWVDELSEVFVTCEQEVLDLIKLGEKFRAVSSTQMNAVSSRSHSLFILSLTQKSRDGTTKMGKLNLADLAGSEKVGKTGASGETLEEAKKINQSLSALGNCINALTKAKKGHVPYRDSKLTFILRESLGGNAKTTLVIACSPHAFNLEETISTLRFGQRAKSIKNKAKINQERSVAELEAIIEKMRAEITKLRAYNEALERELVSSKGSDFNIDEFRKKLMGDLAKRQQHAEERPTSPRPSRDGDDDASSIASDDSDASNTNLDVPSREPSSSQFLSPMPTKTRPSLMTPQTPSTPTQFGGNSIPATPSSPSLFANIDAYDPMAMIEMQLAYDKLKEEKDIQIQDLKEELTQMREELERAKSQHSSEERQGEDNSALTVQLESQTKEFDAYKSKMEYEAKQSALQMETATSSLAILKEDNENLRQTLDKTAGKVSELSQENETLKEQKGELEIKIKTMESQLQQLNQRVSSFEQNAAALTQEKQESLKQQQEKDESIQKLQDSIAVLEDDYNDLTGEMNEAQGKIKVLIQEKELLETALTTAKHTISVLEQSRAAAEKDKSVPGTPRNDALDSASKKISELTNTLEQQASENTSLKKKVTSLESDVEKLKSESANKERKMEQERQKSKTANDTLKALKKELNEMKMVQQQIAFDSEKTLKEAEIKLLTEQNQRLSTQTDLERLKRVLVEREYETKQLNENLSKVTLSFKEESAKRATTTKQLDENSKRLTELEKNIESLQEENSQLKAMLKNNKNNNTNSAKPAATTDISGISKLSEAEKETSTALTEFVRRLQQRSGRVVRPVQSSSLSSGQNSPQTPANNNAPSGTMDSILHFWKEAPKQPENNKQVFTQQQMFLFSDF